MSDLSDLVDLREPDLPAMFSPHLFLPLLLACCWATCSSCREEVETFLREEVEEEGSMWEMVGEAFTLLIRDLRWGLYTVECRLE